jgi:hypothetical protein
MLEEASKKVNLVACHGLGIPLTCHDITCSQLFYQIIILFPSHSFPCQLKQIKEANQRIVDKPSVIPDFGFKAREIYTQAIKEFSDSAQHHRILCIFPQP